jgi:hypothetical protein
MEPNWTPLELKLVPARCVGFMFMGRVAGWFPNMTLCCTKSLPACGVSITKRRVESLPSQANCRLHRL